MVSSSSWHGPESRFAACASKERGNPHQCRAEGNRAKFPWNKLPFLLSHFTGSSSGPSGRNKLLLGGSDLGHIRGHRESSCSINKRTDAKVNRLLRRAQVPEAHRQKEVKFHEGLVSPALQPAREHPLPSVRWLRAPRSQLNSPSVQSCFLHSPDLKRVPPMAPY